MDDQTTTLTAAQGASPPNCPRRIGWGIGALVVVAAITAGLLFWWRLQQHPSVTYVTEPVSRGGVTRSVTTTGTVNPVLTIIVGSYVSEVIESLSCDYNTRVCAKIDPGSYQATLDQYSGQLVRDQAILNRDRAGLARYQKLASQDSIARQQAEDQAYIVRQDGGTVQLDKGLVEGATLNLKYTDIVSPVDGTAVSQRWPASSRQRFGSAKWILCRLGEIHAAAACGRWS